MTKFLRLPDESFDIYKTVLRHQNTALEHSASSLLELRGFAGRVQQLATEMGITGWEKIRTLRGLFLAAIARLARP